MSENADKLKKRKVVSTAVEITTQVGKQQPDSNVNKKSVADKSTKKRKGRAQTRSQKSINNNATISDEVQQESQGLIKGKGKGGKVQKLVGVKDSNPKTKENAYERLVRKVRENRAKRGESPPETSKFNQIAGDAEAEHDSDYPDHERLNEGELDKSYDGIMVDINASDDDFDESESGPEVEVSVNDKVLSQTDALGNAAAGGPSKVNKAVAQPSQREVHQMLPQR